jgi:hypothetical protein
MKEFKRDPLTDCSSWAADNLQELLDVSDLQTIGETGVSNTTIQVMENMQNLSMTIIVISG